MYAYRVCFRLYSLGFLLSWLFPGWISIQSGSVKLAVMIKLAFCLANYLLTLPFNSKYNPYFNNLGFSQGMLFLQLAAADVVIFIAVASTVNWLIHA